MSLADDAVTGGTYKPPSLDELRAGLKSGEHKFDPDFGHRSLVTNVVSYPEMIKTYVDDMIEKHRVPKGHSDNPYLIVVPGWIEDMLHKQGTSAQQWYDENFSVAIRVEVVR